MEGEGESIAGGNSEVPGRKKARKQESKKARKQESKKARKQESMKRQQGRQQERKKGRKEREEDSERKEVLTCATHIKKKEE